MDKAVTRDDVEKAMWMMSSWRVDQADVDRLLSVVDRYAVGQLAVPPPPQTVNDLPLVERVRIDALREGDKDAAYKAGRLDGLAEAAKRQAIRPVADTAHLPTGSEELRRCTYCRNDRPLDRFTRDPKASSGLRTQCKDCEAEVRRARKQRKAEGMGA